MSIQEQQFLNLFLLLLLGSFFSNVYLSCCEMAIILGFTFLFDVGCKSCLHLSVSSLITAMGIILMMVSTHLYIYLIVIALALLQKHYLKIENRHFFNPSNFALIMTLLLFYNEAHIVLGQLGESFYLAVFLLTMAMLILIRVNRWIISLFFTLFYLLFQYLFMVSLDPVLIMEDIYHRFYSISFILFILFMLTDPRTTPSSNVWQLVFALLIALFSTALDYFYGFRIQHLFLSLFFFSLFTPLVELWQTKEKKPLYQRTFLLFILATMAILFIENQSPYYFTMEN